MARDKILVIKLGALGDLVLCCAAFAAIRAFHPEAEIALLTGPSFVPFVQAMPWFDRILTDPRPPAWRLDQWARLIRRVRAFAPTRVYDFQGKPRQSVLFHALGGPRRVAWSGAAKGCAFPRLWPPEGGMHYTAFLAAQLDRVAPELGALCRTAPVAMSWLDAPVARFALPEKYALLIPGCSADRLYKRWPAESYAELARQFKEQGIESLAIGTESEKDALDALCRLNPHVRNMCGQTSLFEVAGLARRAAYVVGNDTGPTHIAAAIGARTCALMSDRVNPLWSAPKGPQARWLQGTPIAAIPLSGVAPGPKL